MHTTFPAFELLLLLSGTLIVGLPLSIWLFMRGYRDQGARLWFLAVALNAAAMILIGWLERFSAVSAVLFVGSSFLAIESMRWELDRPPVNRWIAALVFAAYATLQLTLEAVGLRMSVGYTLNLFLLIGSECTLVALLLKVSKRHNSRGLWMVGLGIALIIVPNIIRLVQALINSGGPEAFAGSPATNAAVFLVTLVSVLQVMGYGGFVMEKLHQRQLQTKTAEALATERRRLAEDHAHAMEALVRQRDDMILLNSRFSTVSNMALYNSAIVHEISQPLQALFSILDTMSLRDEKHGGEQNAHIQNAMTMVRKMSNTLGALRSLMGGQQPKREHLNVDAVLDEIFPILQTQAQRQNVELERKRSSDHGCTVNVNKVLLQRLIFNLVTNAFEALAAQAAKTSSPNRAYLLVVTQTAQEQGEQYCLLRVQDNGPGFPEGLQLQSRLSLHTSKDDGIGMGLGFTQMIVESWRGHLRAHNLPKEHGGGAVVEVCLPLVNETFDFAQAVRR